MRIIKFRSIPRFFDKEKRGVKPNTIRRIEDTDPKAALVRVATHIIIENTETGETFTREITDASYIEMFGLWDISWKHE